MSRTVKETFRQQLCKLQESLALNNVTFARKCGLNTQDIQRYASGNATPSIDKLAQIATSCDKTTDWLLGLDCTDSCTASQPLASKKWKERALSAELKLSRVNKALGHVLKGCGELQEAVR